MYLDPSYLPSPANEKAHNYKRYGERENLYRLDKERNFFTQFVVSNQEKNEMKQC